MRKIIAAINMTLDGFCDHATTIANDELHEHYNELLKSADTMIWGRTTYQLMEEYWPSVAKNPSGNKSEDDFAMLIDDMEKIVYSRTLEDVTWKNTTLKHEINRGEILELKEKSGKDILVGSPSLIIAFTQLGLIDEYQLNVNPIIAGSGLPLFKNISERVDLKLQKTKIFACGAIVLYYETIK